jgi:hypothetical protein
LGVAGCFTSPRGEKSNPLRPLPCQAISVLTAIGLKSVRFGMSLWPASGGIAGLE